MDRLVLLVGASGSGKTTIAKELEKEGYNIIHSYTTRPLREPDEWGHTFIGQYNPNVIMKESEILHSINWKEYLLPKKYHKKDIIAFKELYDNYYFATKDQYQGKGTSIYVVDPSGAEQVRQNVKDAEVLTLFLMVDEKERFRRLFTSREKGTSERRVIQDREIFSKCKCDYVVDANRELGQVVTDIKEIIKESN